MLKARKVWAVCGAVLMLLGLTSCSPEVGSEGWCEQMKEKPKGDWTASEAADYAKYCIFK